MSDRTVQVKSLVNYAVVVSIPEYHYDHLFHGEGKVTRVPFDALQEGIQADSIRNLFIYGILQIPSKKDKIDLGLEIPVDEIDESTDIESVEVEEEIYSLSISEMLTLLKTGTMEELETALKKSSSLMIQQFITTAIKFKVYTGQTIDLLQKYADDETDIHKLIALASAAEKPEPQDN